MRSVVFLGVGGVGKTTYIYKVLGLSKAPRVTRRPGFYPLPIGDLLLYLVDTPGQYAVEVARRYYDAVKTFGARIDLVVYVYSVVEPETLGALWEIEEWVSRFSPRRKSLWATSEILQRSSGSWPPARRRLRLLGLSGFTTHLR
jgi:hypothetical protein